MENVLEFIENLNISKSDTVVVSCSFGPDSMYLLYIMHKYFDCKVVCAHVNHKIRKESDEEYQRLEKYCIENDIIFEGTEINDYSSADNFHEYARNYRYRYFEEIVMKYHAKYLFTAHHGDDLMETILMHILRGGSVYGYSGFDFLVEKRNYKIARPLIYLSKEQIEMYDNELGIPYSIDQSNLEDHYTRNRFRHHVLPFFKQEDTNAHLKFLRYSENLKECTSFLDNYCYSILSDIYQNNILDLNGFAKLDIYIKKEILYKILMRIYNNNLSLINSNHILYLLSIIDNNKPNLEITLPNNVKILKEYDKLIFNAKNSGTKYDYILNDKVITPYGKIFKVSQSEEKSNYLIRLNSKQIKMPIHVTVSHDGDKMYIKNMEGSKKVNKIFIDEKISKQKRSDYPIVKDADGNILWIPGIKKSKFDIEKNEVYDIILKYEKGECL